MDCARKYKSYKNKWVTVLFSDEKEWNLDDPSDWNNYLHGFTNQKSTFFSKRQGGHWWFGDQLDLIAIPI